MRFNYDKIDIPESKKRTGRICDIVSLTAVNGDLDSDIHEGFTVGKGKTMYWTMVWHSWGNVTVYAINGDGRRWLPGDTEITVHFK